MEEMLRGLAELLCSYGVWAAGLFSGHGTFEETVPANLVSFKCKNSNNY